MAPSDSGQSIEAILQKRIAKMRSGDAAPRCDRENWFSKCDAIAKASADTLSRDVNSRCIKGPERARHPYSVCAPFVLSSKESTASNEGHKQIKIRDSTERMVVFLSSNIANQYRHSRRWYWISTGIAFNANNEKCTSWKKLSPSYNFVKLIREHSYIYIFFNVVYCILNILNIYCIIKNILNVLIILII